SGLLDATVMGEPFGHCAPIPSRKETLKAEQEAVTSIPRVVDLLRCDDARARKRTLPRDQADVGRELVSGEARDIPHDHTGHITPFEGIEALEHPRPAGQGCPTHAEVVIDHPDTLRREAERRRQCLEQVLFLRGERVIPYLSR